ncbi:MAG: ferredoxin--nitrite reductase [Chloroflexi bacterium]|nr:ferredoxin--nitrite reductase [Chloroflexota bacterium]
MNKFERMKAERDGLDSYPDLLRHAEANTPAAEIPDDVLQRMKWFGVFYRPRTPGSFMMRLRVPGGRLTAEQLRAFAMVAREHGHDSVDFTTRQNVQLRGLPLPAIPKVIQALNEAGVATLQTGLDNVRNYIGCPLAGIDGVELFDTTPLLAAMAEAHLGKKAYSNLPRKFNVSLAGCREDCGHAQTQDLGFAPATKRIDGRRVAGFNVLVGGALGGTSPRLATPLDVFVRPQEVVALFTATLCVYRDHGPREKRTEARLKWLIKEWGEERLRQAVEEQLGHPLERAGHDECLRVAGDHLGIHAQRQVGMHYVGLHVPVGRISAGQLQGLARLADDYGAGEVRLTVGQNVILPHVPEAKLSTLLADPLLQELRPNPPGIWRNLVACTGTDYCHFSLIDTKTRAVELAQKLERSQVQVPDGTRIHVSGCVHACGKHHIADIGLQGTNIRVSKGVEESVDVFVGGKLGPDGRLATKTLEAVHVEELPILVEALLRERFHQSIPLPVLLAAGSRHAGVLT